MNILDKGARQLGINLSRCQLEWFELYYRELVEWNRNINLTAITDYEEVQIKHFLDSLSIVPYLGILRSKIKVIDVGAGAGLPGIPLKIALPDIELTLVDATAKKTRFLQYLLNLLEMSDVEVVTGRAEEIAHQSHYREQYYLALARAVAPLPATVELALPFCAPGGMFIAQKKGNIEQEIEQSMRAISEMGGRLRETVSVEIERINDGRKLVIIDKVKPTPAKYPRRAGIPEKRPII